MMEFFNTPEQSVVSDKLLSIIINTAQHKKVLFLMPGGSASSIARNVIENIPVELRASIAISLTDERYGAVGHADENWTLITDGLNLEGYTLCPVNEGLSLDVTVQNYANNLLRLREWADVVIGLFGMGADGHTAGILPYSTAVLSNDAACGYKAGQFTRITTTTSYLRSIDVSILYAVGREKHAMIDRLSDDIPLVDMPAQILKSINECYVYNDYKGDTNK